MKFNVSPDVGHSSTKMILVEGEHIRARKQPTVISYLPAIPPFEDADLATLVSNLHKNMVVHITSPSIKRGGLYAVGSFANQHGGLGYNIKTHRKADQDVTLIQPLAMIAVSAIQNAYEADNKLPDTIHVTTNYTSAIPVVDYSKADAKALQDRLVGEHILIVYVGEGLQVSVTISVTGAKIVQEGIPAFYALLQGDPELFTEYNERYNLEVTGKHFENKKILFVDIGEGSLELISVVDGVPVVTKSTGYRYGVGHAGVKAITSFKEEHNIKTNLTRSMFMQKVLDEQDIWHQEAVSALNLSTFEQQSLIADAVISHIENVILYDLEEVVVFGGGTNVFKDLKTDLRAYAEQYKMRVLWVEGDMASLLNAYGLDVLNRSVFFPEKESV